MDMFITGILIASGIKTNPVFFLDVLAYTFLYIDFYFILSPIIFLSMQILGKHYLVLNKCMHQYKNKNDYHGFFVFFVFFL